MHPVLLTTKYGLWKIFKSKDACCLSEHNKILSCWLFVKSKQDY